MKENRKKSALRAAAVTTAAAAVVVAAGAAATQLLVKTALDREEPKLVRRFGKKRVHTARDRDYGRARHDAAKKLEALPHEVVTLVSHDGEQLCGHWFPCKNAKRAVLAMHGWRSSWSMDFGLIAEFWFRTGCSVLFAEQRGQNNSGGDYMGFGLAERFDCLDWANWIDAREKGKLPIYLSGVSMGASTVLMAAGLRLPENVRGVIADCGFTSPEAIWEHVAQEKLHLGRSRLRSALVDRQFRRRLKMSAHADSTTQALRRCKIPVLLIHGTEDRFVPIEMTYENYLACASPKRLLIVPGAAHAQSCFVEPERYEVAVAALFADCERME